MSNLSKQNIELGKSILQAAQELFDKRRTEAVMEQVVAIHQALAECKASWNTIEKRRKIFSDRLRAIEKGDFTFDERSGKISFHKDELESVG